MPGSSLGIWYLVLKNPHSKRDSHGFTNLQILNTGLQYPLTARFGGPCGVSISPYFNCARRRGRCAYPSFILLAGAARRRAAVETRDWFVQPDQGNPPRSRRGRAANDLYHHVSDSLAGAEGDFRRRSLGQYVFVFVKRQLGPAPLPQAAGAETEARPARTRCERHFAFLTASTRLS